MLKSVLETRLVRKEMSLKIGEGGRRTLEPNYRDGKGEKWEQTLCLH